MRRTILLADDSTTIRRLVIQTFADLNFRIVEASNGDAAIKMLEEVRPNIVLTDIYMPGKNGYEVCAYVRNHRILGGTPVILLVGAFDAFDEETAQASGASANITKPFEPGALIELVTSFLPPEEEEDIYDKPEEAAASPVSAAPPAASVAAPEVAVPEVAVPELAAPEVAASEVAAPEVAAPELAAPELAAPELAVPEPAVPEPNDEDLLGLETIFTEDVFGPSQPAGLTDDDIDRIADRVIQRLSSDIIESIAWDIVPEITEKIVREELKRIDDR